MLPRKRKEGAQPAGTRFSVISLGRPRTNPDATSSYKNLSNSLYIAVPLIQRVSRYRAPKLHAQKGVGDQKSRLGVQELKVHVCKTQNISLPLWIATVRAEH
jgi:hypothetical protein